LARRGGASASWISARRIALLARQLSPGPGYLRTHAGHVDRAVLAKTAPSMTGTPDANRDRVRRFLFVMQYPGYLRYFDSTVRLLAERGHRVDVVFDSPHKQPEGSEALAGVPGVTWLGQTPRRDDVWGVVGKAVRGAIDYLRYLHPKFADAHYLRARMRDVLPPALSFLGRWQSASVSTTRRAFPPFLAWGGRCLTRPIVEG